MTRGCDGLHWHGGGGGGVCGAAATKEKNLRRGNNYIFAKEFTHKNGIVLFIFSKQLTIELVYQSISRIPPDNYYAIDYVFPLYYAKDILN